MSEQPEAEDVAKEDVGQTTIETVLSLLTASPLSVTASISTFMVEETTWQASWGVVRKQYIVMSSANEGSEVSH